MIRLWFFLFLFNISFSSIHATGNLDFSQLEHYEGIKYLTYTKSNKNSAVDIRKVNVNDNYETVFVIHGFDEKNLDKTRKVKNELFQFNLNVERVIIVSWLEYSQGSVSNAYQKVVHHHVPRLAHDLYEKIVYIRENGAHGAIQLVGYSVGAHVAGQTGRLLQINARYALDQIIGLDPAGDHFSDYSDRALHKEDAKKVVVLHTNINNYGFGSQIRPNDKMVNGGEKQPNCKINVDKCSHYEAWNVFSLYAKRQLGENSEKDGVVQTFKPVNRFDSIPADRPLSGRKEIIHFTVNDTSEKDAEFTIISHNLQKFYVELISPSGEQFSSSSPEYFSDDLVEKGFRIPNAEPGQWSLTVDKYLNRRLSARQAIDFSARSRQVSKIALTADVSHRLLEYPDPITVLGELKFKGFPIIYADVFAYIEAPNLEPIRLPLYDNGIYPDELENDHTLDDYRPISMLPSLSKALEKILKFQITDHLNHDCPPA